MTLYKYLTEAKQVGIIYHFTYDIHNLREILKTDSLTTSVRKAISLTRNYNLGVSENFEAYVRLTLDGNKMSEHEKIVPHLYDPSETDGLSMPASIQARRKAYGQEQEERIDKTEVKNIKASLLEIDIHENLFFQTFMDDDDILDSINAFDKIREQYPKFKVRLVSEFTPYGKPKKLSKQYYRFKTRMGSRYMPTGEEW